MKIGDDSAGCYSEDLRMQIVSRDTARGLDGKRTEEGKQELLGAEQSLRVECGQEGAYEALEKQRRDDVARDGIGSTFAPRMANGPRHIIPLRSPLEKAVISTVFMFTRPLRNSIPRWLPSTWSSFTSINHNRAHVSASSHQGWIMLAKNAQRSYSATDETSRSRRIAKSSLRFNASWLKMPEWGTEVLLKFSVIRNLSNGCRKLGNGREQSGRRRQWHH